MTDPASPPLALLLDLDGPVASPVTRSINIPSIADDLVALAAAGVPIVFNTGRSDAFVREQIVTRLHEAGLPEGAAVFAICEKGAVWFEIRHDGIGEIEVDESLGLPRDYADDVRTLVASDYADVMFFDETKRAMVSVEQQLAVDNELYLRTQPAFDAAAATLMTERGWGVVRNDDTRPDAAGEVAWRIDPTIISTDIESVRVGKDLGAERAIELLAARGIHPQVWRTMGDSRTDYAMAEWLYEHDYLIAHVDVRPADGIPATDYPVFTAGSLIHDEAGAAFLAHWRGAIVDDAPLDEEGLAAL